MDEEQYLGGLSSFALGKKGGINGYGIYATNKRIIGVKSWKDTLKGIAGFIPLIVIAAYEQRVKKEQNTEILERLEEKKDFEISKEQISRLELAIPRFFQTGKLVITPKSGKTTCIYVSDKKIAKNVRDLMQAFFPEVLTVKD